MKSRTIDQFRSAFADLPEQVQKKTREAYRQFKQAPSHPSRGCDRALSCYQRI